MRVQHTLYAVQHEPQLFDAGFNSQREGCVDQQFRPSLHVLELHLRQRPVGNNQQIWSKVRSFRERNPISSTVPSLPPISQKSPTCTALSISNETRR